LQLFLGFCFFTFIVVTPIRLSWDTHHKNFSCSKSTNHKKRSFVAVKDCCL